ncbi:hypothetical protein BJF77_10285 [Kocuria sp. CNJ-770]|nr:hypothetical protein BJF77_10285 [Kocuria sp. CNJ-770]
MNASRPHSSATGTPSQISARVSTAATISPNTVVTSRYFRLVAAKWRSATASSPGAPRRAASLPGKDAASTAMNSTRVTMKKRSVSRASSPPSSPPAREAIRPRSTPERSREICSCPTPTWARAATSPSSSASSSAW